MGIVFLLLAITGGITLMIAGAISGFDFDSDNPLFARLFMAGISMIIISGFGVRSRVFKGKGRGEKWRQ